MNIRDKLYYGFEEMSKIELAEICGKLLKVLSENEHDSVAKEQLKVLLEEISKRFLQGKKGGEKMKVIKPALELLRVDKAFAISARSERRNMTSCSCQCS